MEVPDRLKPLRFGLATKSRIRLHRMTGRPAAPVQPSDPAVPPEPEPAGNEGEAEASGGVIPDAKSDEEPAE